MNKSIGTQSCKTRRQAKNKEQFHNFTSLAKFPFLFDFCLSLLCFLTKLSLCNSFYFCQFGNLHCLVVYNAQTTLCKDNFSFIIEFLGKLVEQALVCFSFSLIFFSFLTSQTPSEDDNSEDEWLNPLLP